MERRSRTSVVPAHGGKRCGAAGRCNEPTQSRQSETAINDLTRPDLTALARSYFGAIERGDLAAHSATFFTFKQGRIRTQFNYDGFEAF